MRWLIYFIVGMHMSSMRRESLRDGDVFLSSSLVELIHSLIQQIMIISYVPNMAQISGNPARNKVKFHPFTKLTWPASSLWAGRYAQADKQHIPKNSFRSYVGNSMHISQENNSGWCPDQPK